MNKILAGILGFVLGAAAMTTVSIATPIFTTTVDPVVDEQMTVSTETEHPELQPINDIVPADFYADYIENPDDYDFIDVRGLLAYEAVHAAGSRNLPLHQLYFEKDVLPKTGKTIVFICSGGVASGVAYHYLEHHGFTNIARVDGGIEAWTEAGLPAVYSQQDVLGS